MARLSASASILALAALLACGGGGGGSDPAAAAPGIDADPNASPAVDASYQKVPSTALGPQFAGGLNLLPRRALTCFPGKKESRGEQARKSPDH